MVFESNYHAGPFSVYSQQSTDDGFTWGDRVTFYSSTNGASSGAPSAFNVGEKTFVGFMTGEDASNTGTYDGGVSKVVYSSNGGSSWSSASKTSPSETTTFSYFMGFNDNTFFTFYHLKNSQGTHLWWGNPINRTKRTF